MPSFYLPFQHEFNVHKGKKRDTKQRRKRNFMLSQERLRSVLRLPGRSRWNTSELTRRRSAETWLLLRSTRSEGTEARTDVVAGTPFYLGGLFEIWTPPEYPLTQRRQVGGSSSLSQRTSSQFATLGSRRKKADRSFKPRERGSWERGVTRYEP